MDEKGQFLKTVGIFFAVFYLVLGYGNIIFMSLMKYFSFFGMLCFLGAYGIGALMVFFFIGQKFNKNAQIFISFFSGSLLIFLLAYVVPIDGIGGLQFGGAGPFILGLSFFLEPRVVSLVALPIEYFEHRYRLIYLVFALMSLSVFLIRGEIRWRKNLSKALITIVIGLSVLCVVDGVYQARNEGKLAIDGAPDLAYVGYQLYLNTIDQRPLQAPQDSDFTSPFGAYSQLIKGTVDMILVYEPTVEEQKFIGSFSKQWVFLPLGYDQLTFFVNQATPFKQLDKKALLSILHGMNAKGADDSTGSPSIYLKSTTYSSYQWIKNDITSDVMEPRNEIVNTRNPLVSVFVPFKEIVPKYKNELGAIGMGMGSEVKRYEQFADIKRLTIVDEYNREITVRRKVYLAYRKNNGQQEIDQVVHWLATDSGKQALLKWGLMPLNDVENK